MNFEQLIHACEQTHVYLQGTAVSTVNQSLTIRNWLFGHYIVEYEQNGEDRAKYGDQLLTELAKDLKSKGIKGLSAMLKIGSFYLSNSHRNAVIDIQLFIDDLELIIFLKSEKINGPGIDIRHGIGQVHILPLTVHGLTQIRCYHT